MFVDDDYLEIVVEFLGQSPHYYTPTKEYLCIYCGSEREKLPDAGNISGPMEPGHYSNCDWVKLKLATIKYLRTLVKEEDKKPVRKMTRRIRTTSPIFRKEPEK